MKCALTTLHDENYKQLADFTWHNNREKYAARHGYGAIAKTDGWGTMNKIGRAHV